GAVRRGPAAAPAPDPPDRARRRPPAPPPCPSPRPPRPPPTAPRPPTRRPSLRRRPRCSTPFLPHPIPRKTRKNGPIASLATTGTSPAAPEAPPWPIDPRRRWNYSVCAGSITPYWLASRASEIMSLICSFSNSRVLWVLIVFALRLRRRAI